MSKFGRVQRVKNDDGSVRGVTMYVTKDITLQKGQTVYFNDLEESLNKDVEFNYISETEKLEKLAQSSEMDEKFNRETLYIAKAGKVKEVQTKGI